jgi:PKD repeat protein
MRVRVVMFLLLLALFPAAANAAPTNDQFADAQVIDPAALPFSDSSDPGSATLEPGEPGSCGFSGGSVWYAITPASNVHLSLSVSGPATVQAFRGSTLGNLQGLGCGQSFSVRADAGVTYYLQMSGFGTVALNVSRIVPPVGDDFADAQAIDSSSLPFRDTQSGAGASGETNEPAACAPFGPLASWWYAFTPTVSGSYTVSASSGPGLSVAAFRGSALNSLTLLTCSSYYGARTSFAASAGTTYYVQVNDAYRGQFGPTTMSVEVAPDPVANFGWWPADPSTVDTVNFNDQSSDPGGTAIQSVRWDLGDGTTIPAGQPATHRYATDGDYQVKQTITTADGRTASVTRTVTVRTHDVGITTLGVPKTARLGQSKSITVGVANASYSERVTVQLLKSVAGGGFEQVGALTQTVAARGRNRPTDFPFSYTFTADDARAGSVTFQAVATLVDARDARSGDNTVIALPTKVNP